MRTIRDFCCTACGQTVEKLMDTEVTQIICQECGCDAVQLMGMPTVRLEGLTGAFPGAHHKWAQIREDNARIKAARA